MSAFLKKTDRGAEKQISLTRRVTTLQRLMCEANENPNEVVKLQAYINENPDLCERISVLAHAAKEDLLGKLLSTSGSQIVVREELAGMKKNLSGKNSTWLEMLLIDAVLMCWLRLQYAEGYRTNVADGKHSFDQIDFADKMLTRAHNRFNRAIESLARLQRLNQPKTKHLTDRLTKVERVIKAVSKSR